MPYLIRSRGLRLDIRDRGAEGQPLRRLSDSEWTRFEALPVGVIVEGDGDVEVRVLEPEQPAPPVEAYPITAEEVEGEKPVDHKGRFRRKGR